MGIIEKDSDELVEAVAAWDPGPAFSEKRCRDSLLRFLKQRFPRETFHVEHRLGKARADIYVDFEDWTGFGAKVVIELKFGLTTMNEYHRLVGQVADYTGVAEVMVVLCGESAPDLAARVRAHLKVLAEKRLFFGKFHVVHKPVGARLPDGRFRKPASSSP